MFSSNRHILVQMCQNNKLPKFMIQIRLQSFIFQMWSICVVCFLYCKHFTWAEHVKGYTSRKHNVLLNSIGCYYMLAIAVANFITSRGGTNKFIMEFVILGDYLKLKIDVDISFVGQHYRLLVYRCIKVF